MAGLVTDTHAVVWYLLESPRLSRVAFAHLQEAAAKGAAILIPAVCLVEIVYLIEKRRITPVAQERLYQRLDDPDSDLRVIPLDRRVAEAVARIPRDQVPDMPDRIIAATALHLGVPLVTRDGRIRASGIETIW
jgi:PIN domain nuclease of toxin-antitoxin system